MSSLHDLRRKATGALTNALVDFLFKTAGMEAVVDAIADHPAGAAALQRLSKALPSPYASQPIQYPPDDGWIPRLAPRWEEQTWEPGEGEPFRMNDLIAWASANDIDREAQWRTQPHELLPVDFRNEVPAAPDFQGWHPYLASWAKMALKCWECIREEKMDAENYLPLMLSNLPINMDGSYWTYDFTSFHWYRYNHEQRAWNKEAPQDPILFMPSSQCLDPRLWDIPLRDNTSIFIE